MFNKFGLTAAILFSVATSPAAAVSVVDGKCPSVTLGCLFDGNIAPNTVAATQAAYNLYNNTHAGANPDINLQLLFKSDDGSAFKGSFTGANTARGTWSTPGYTIDYLAVKSSHYFMLFKLGTSPSSGTWDTFGIPFNRNPHALSHLTFFGHVTTAPGVPEPASWALMILGFGLVGSAARRQHGRSPLALGAPRS